MLIYKQQLVEEKDDEENKKVKFYSPVVTLVLYFGKRHWKKPRSLIEVLKVPEELKPFVKDYGINVFEIAHLTDEQVDMFRSDFRIVADYFVQMRKSNKYIPSKQVIKHVEEILQMMKILTGDEKFDYIYENSFKEGEKITMDTWLSDTIGKAEKKAEKKEDLKPLRKW